MVRLFRVAFTKQAGKFSRSPAIGQTFQGSPETGLSATRHPIFLSKVQKRTGSFSEGIWLQVSKVSEYSWLLTQWSQVVEINHEENLDKGKDLAAKMARYCFYNNTILDLGMGFILMGLIYWLGERLSRDSQVIRIVFMILGLLLCYAFGTAWFM